MVHGDDDGLVLPPKIAPVQVMIIPINQKKEGVLEKSREIQKELEKTVRVKMDDSDKKPGWKFSEQEMRGIPLRVEIGPKDIEKGQCVIVRRDTREKITASLDGLSEEIPRILEKMHQDMLERARKHRDQCTYEAANFDEFQEIAANKPGFIKAMWCGDLACEMKIKDEVGVTSRCIPFEQKKISDTCVCCGRPAKSMVYWGKAY